MNIECYLCENPNHFSDSIYIRKINNLWICYKCVGNKNSIWSYIPTIKDDIICPICFNKKCNIQLPNCNHTICIDCCKYIYFGYLKNSSIKYTSVFNLDEYPDFPFEYLNNNINENIYFQCVNWIENNYDFKNSTLKNILDKQINRCDKPYFMNNNEILKWEIDYIKCHYLVNNKIKTNKKIIKNKQKNILNKCCPFCRK
jgi:hypothetical protein